MPLFIVQIFRSLILTLNLAVFSEPPSNSGSSGWGECKCTACSACCVFTVKKNKGNLLDPVCCVSRDKTKT